MSFSNKAVSESLPDQPLSEQALKKLKASKVINSLNYLIDLLKFRLWIWEAP